MVDLITLPIPFKCYEFVEQLVTFHDGDAFFIEAFPKMDIGLCGTVKGDEFCSDASAAEGLAHFDGLIAIKTNGVQLYAELGGEAHQPSA